MKYFSLDEAVAELRQRQAIESQIIARLSGVLGRSAWQSCPFPLEGTIGLLPRYVATARLEDVQFFERCCQAGLWPVWGDYSGDSWSSENRDKLRLCHIRVDDGEVKFSRRLIKEPQRWNRRPIAAVLTNSGESLVSYHHRLWQAVFGGQGEIIEVSSWFKQLGGRAKHYYFAYLAVMTVRAVLFESFDTDGAPSSFSRFVGQVVEPAWQAVVGQVGLEPLIVKHPLADSLEQDQRIRDYYDPRVIPEANKPPDKAARKKAAEKPYVSLWSGYE